MGVQAVEFSMGSGSENAVDRMLIGVNKVRTGSDANVEASEPRDLPFFRSVIHFTQYLHVDVRPVKERPDGRFRHYDLLSTLQFSRIPRVEPVNMRTWLWRDPFTRCRASNEQTGS